MSAAGIALLIIAQFADYSTFLLMVYRHGLGTELNPLAVTLTAEHGLMVLTFAKVAAVLLAAATFLIVRRTRPRIAAGVLVFGILAGAVGAYSNIITIQAPGPQ